MFNLSIAMALLQPQSVDSNVGCVFDQLSPAERSAFLDEGTSGQVGRGSQAVEQAIGACTARLGWDQASALRFGNLSAAAVIGDVARNRLRSGGIDPGLVVKWFQAQPVSTRQSITKQSMTALFELLSARGIITPKVIFHSEDLASLVASLALIDAAEGPGANR